MTEHVSRMIADQTIEGVLIDMDDTLFLEHSYVLSGIEAVARFLAPKTNEQSDMLIERLTYRFLKFGRKNLFDPEVEMAKNCSIAEVVEVYRHHRPKIELFAGVDALVQRLAARFPVALVTDGAHIMQRQKVEALGLDKLVRDIVYCSTMDAPKPQPRSFLRAAEAMNIAPANCVVIGDDPTADVAGAQAAGMMSIRVMTGRYSLLKSSHKPDAQVANFAQAAEILLNETGE